MKYSSDDNNHSYMFKFIRDTDESVPTLKKDLLLHGFINNINPTYWSFVCMRIVNSNVGTV